MEGLTTLRSATASRLRRSVGGPPAKPPTLVRGFGWVAVVVTGLVGSLTLGRLQWYSPTAPGDAAQRQHDAERVIVAPFLTRWGHRVIWLVDRGFGNGSFLSEALGQARFVARWRRDYHLRNARTGEVAGASALTWRIRSQWTLQVQALRGQQTWTMGLASLPVTLPDDSRPLWLVVARRKGKKNGSIWLLTTQDASTEGGAALVVRAYARRWQVEWAFRFQKSGLGIESIRLAAWTYCQKLWRLAELAHAFLLSLVVLLDVDARAALLRWCHRTGKQAAETIAPLDRLRHALANLWNSQPPTITWAA